MILEYNGEKVHYSSDLPPLVGRTPVNTDAKVKVLRDGKARTIMVHIGELPAEEEIAQDNTKPEKAKTDRLGLIVSTPDADMRKALELPKGGVVVEQIAKGAAAEAGIQRGDVIIKLNNKDVDDTKDFSQLVDDLPAGKSVPVLILRQNGPIFIALRVPED